MRVKAGDVVLIKGDERNRGKWKIGIVDKLMKGRDGIVQAVQLRAGKSYLERTIQHLYPMELSRDITTPRTIFNLETPEFEPSAAEQPPLPERISESLLKRKKKRNNRDNLGQLSSSRIFLLLSTMTAFLNIFYYY